MTRRFVPRIARNLAVAVVAAVGALAPLQPAAAGQRTVTLEVPMSCAACPYIVERTLERVGGVVDVAVSYPEQTATVTFDDAETGVAALTEAVAGVGFSATPLGQTGGDGE